jgi:hypothetical protein
MYTYGGKKTALSGPDATRRLESNSGAMNRAARKLRRQGYGGAAERMALAAAQTGLEERPESGPRWKSYETKMAEADFANQQQVADNRNASRLARLSGMEVAAAEQRLQRYLNPSTSSPTAGASPSAAPATTPMGTAPTAVSVPPLLARPASAPTLGSPKLSDSDYRVKRESAIAAELGYGELTDAQKSVAAQGKIGGVREGQFAYEDRQRLREQGIDKGYVSPAEESYVQSLGDAKTAEVKAREQARMKRIRDKVGKLVQGNPSLYGSTPYTPINPLLKP